MYSSGDQGIPVGNQFALGDIPGSRSRKKRIQDCCAASPSVPRHRDRPRVVVSRCRPQRIVAAALKPELGDQCSELHVAFRFAVAGARRHPTCPVPQGHGGNNPGCPRNSRRAGLEATYGTAPGGAKERNALVAPRSTQEDPRLSTGSPNLAGRLQSQ